MNYQEFKEAVEKKFMSYMPGEYKGMTLLTVKSMKTNVELDGMYIKEIRDSKGVAPTLYINDIYRHYLMEDKNFEKVMKEAAEVMVEGIENIPQLEIPTFGKESHENIVFYLVNAKQNEKMLEKMPHRRFLDLAIVYRMIIDENMSMNIKNDMADYLDLNEEQLYELALKNTQEKLNLEVFKIAPYLWVLTNERINLGAAAMLYDGILQKMAEKQDSDLYIIPSSIHEVVTIPTCVMTPEEAAEMVRKVNNTEVDIQERLSYQVYKYSRETRQIEFATKETKEEEPWK